MSPHRPTSTPRLPGWKRRSAPAADGGGSSMEVSFYATLRDVVGAKKVQFDLPPGSTVRGLLNEAGLRFPGLKPLIWEADGRLRDYIKVFVDGRETRHLKGLETVVAADASVDIFPPAAGG